MPKNPFAPVQSKTGKKRPPNKNDKPTKKIKLNNPQQKQKPKVNNSIQPMITNLPQNNSVQAVNIKSNGIYFVDYLENKNPEYKKVYAVQFNGNDYVYPTGDLHNKKKLRNIIPWNTLKKHRNFKEKDFNISYVGKRNKEEFIKYSKLPQTLTEFKTLLGKYKKKEDGYYFPGLYTAEIKELNAEIHDIPKKYTYLDSRKSQNREKNFNNVNTFINRTANNKEFTRKEFVNFFQTFLKKNEIILFNDNVSNTKERQRFPQHSNIKSFFNAANIFDGSKFTKKEQFMNLKLESNKLEQKYNEEYEIYHQCSVKIHTSEIEFIVFDFLVFENIKDVSDFFISVQVNKENSKFKGDFDLERVLILNYNQKKNYRNAVKNFKNYGEFKYDESTKTLISNSGYGPGINTYSEFLSTGTYWKLLGDASQVVFCKLFNKYNIGNKLYVLYTGESQDKLPLLARLMKTNVLVECPMFLYLSPNSKRKLGLNFINRLQKMSIN